MQSAAPGIAVGLSKTRNFLFFVAVLCMHAIVGRPTPADGIFMIVLYLSVVLNPTINSRFLIFSMLSLAWCFSMFFSSIHVLSNPEVQFQLLSHTFVVLLGVTGCFMAMSWGESNFLTFMNVYLVACCIAACLGIIGFVGNIDLFLWDGRARALFPEPIVFGGFLMPGVFAGTYLLSQGRRKLFPLVALLLCIVGVLLSFSRGVVVSLIVMGPIYYLILNRARFARATACLVIAIVVASAVTAIALLSFPAFEAKVFDRMTLAKDYDAAPGGRYDRYLLSIPLILENPLGLGMLEIDKVFSEPVHNIFISSFVNYGWVAGVAWILLTLLSFKIALSDYRASRSPIAIWLSFSLLAQLPSALLQQVEHWRHLWLFLGLLWGFKPRNFPVPAPTVPRAWVQPQMQRS